MRVPTRAREISFTFTPRRVYRPLWSGDGGADSVVLRRLCTRQAFAVRRFLREAAPTAWPQTLTPAPEPMPFAAAVNRASSLAPPITFSTHDAPPLSERRQRRIKVAVPPGHARAAMGEGSVLCTSGRRRAKMDGCGASGFSLKSYCSAIRVLQNVVIRRGFFTFYTEKIVLSQSSCIFVHGMSSDGNKCARCRTRAPRGPMKTTTSRIPLLADVLIGTTVCTRIDPYRRINSLHRKQ